MAAVLTIVGCTGRDGSDRAGKEDSASELKEIIDQVMTKAFENSGSAFLMIEVMEAEGRLPGYQADLLRARVYGGSLDGERLDSAIIIGERLMTLDVAKENQGYRFDLLEMLVNVARKQHDDEMMVLRGTQMADLCRGQGMVTEALRTEAEIGLAMTHIGQDAAGMAKIDSCISRLSAVRHFNELDASIIALKRKITVLTEQDRHADIIPVAYQILDHLADYEQHPGDFHDDTYREPSDEDRPGYIDFYRSQAYAFTADAYAHTDPTQAHHYLALFGQYSYAQTYAGRKMIAPTLCLLGEYDKMEDIYKEVEANIRANGDTVCADYATLLHDRANSAEAKGRKDEALSLQKRYEAVSEQLHDRLVSGKAHLYAARYHAQEQQREIDCKSAEAERNKVIAYAAGLLALLALAIIAILLRQHRIVSRKNRVLVGQIEQAVIYKERCERQEEQIAALQGTTVTESPADTSVAPGAMDATALFAHISRVIEKERLYLNPSFDRQAIIDHFHITKERVGQAFTQGSSFSSVADYIRDLRLSHACTLLTSHPDMSMGEVMTASGFSNQSVFTRYFKQRYDVTPSVYRRMQQDKK